MKNSFKKIIISAAVMMSAASAFAIEPFPCPMTPLEPASHPLVPFEVPMQDIQAH